MTETKKKRRPRDPNPEEHEERGRVENLPQDLKSLKSKLLRR